MIGISGMFTIQNKNQIAYTDAAGIIFFANQFKIIHDAYEDLLKSTVGASKRCLKARVTFFLSCTLSLITKSLF